MKKLLRTVQGEITTAEPLVVVLPDSVEGDIKFNFYLKQNEQNPKSYTELIIVSPNEANVSLYNIKEKLQASVAEDIPVGTYQNKYKLYLNYILFCKTREAGTIMINFYTEEK